MLRFKLLWWKMRTFREDIIFVQHFQCAYSIEKYLTLSSESLLYIAHKQAENFYSRVTMQHYAAYIICTIEAKADPEFCVFQVPAGIQKPKSVYFYNNTGFQRLVYGYPFSSCRWNDSSVLNPGAVLGSIINGTNAIVAGQENCVCLCYSNQSDCFSNKTNGQIYPGQ